MTVEELSAILRTPQSRGLKFEAQLPAAEILAGNIAAMANADGGILIIGYDGNKSFSVNSKNVKLCLDKARKLLIPEPQITLRQFKISGKELAVITVTKSSGPIGIIGDTASIPLRQYKRARLAGGVAGRTPSLKTQEPIFKSPEYQPKPMAGRMIDSGMEPCFGVDLLAGSFFKLLKQASEPVENTCFLGVFGKWGRGKTYFIERLKKVIKDSDDSDCYDFVQFNAWKYQSTPQIWAYLTHTLWNHKCFLGRLKFYLRWRYLWLTLIVGALIFITGVCCYIAYNDWNSNSSDTRTTLSLFTATFSLVTLFTSYFKLYHSSLSTFPKKNVSPTDDLGTQLRYEKEIELTVKRWNWGLPYWVRRIRKKQSRKIVLVIEDIDRCNESSMIAIIEALKLILENPLIARRMIVIAAIDSDRLLNAYQIRFRAVTDDKDRSRRLAIRQLNKIFLAGIKLPKLTDKNLTEFVDKLSQTHAESDTYGPSASNPSSTDSDSQESRPTSTGESSESAPGNLLTPLHLASYIKDAITDGELANATPRELRVLFYRLVFLNNMLYDRRIQFTPEMASEIIDRSIGKRNGKLDENVDAIIESAVPYQI